MTLALSPVWKQGYFKEAKTVKIGTRFIVETQHNMWGEHIEKQFVYWRQKQGTNTQSGVWASWMRSMVERWFKSLTQDSPSRSLFTFGQLSCFFFHTWFVLRPSPKMHVQLFAKMDSTAEACGDTSTLVIWWEPLAFPPPRSLPARMQTGKVSLISIVGTLSLYFSRIQLLLLALSLEYLAKNKASILLHNKHQLSSPEAHLSPTSIQPLWKRFSVSIK